MAQYKKQGPYLHIWSCHHLCTLVHFHCKGQWRNKSKNKKAVNWIEIILG